MTNPVQEAYGNRLRVRVCGILVEEGALLMINHRSLAEADFWAPPGGGINFTESATTCLIREIKEETGIDIEVLDLLFTCEFIKAPLHAIELFFRVKKLGGTLTTGTDPELKAGDQIIKNVAFVPWGEIQKMDPKALHGIFRFVEEPAQITRLRGLFTV